jgi:Mg2+/Co2+ transporter CorB
MSDPTSAPEAEAVDGDKGDGDKIVVRVRRIHRRDLNRVWEFLKLVFRDVNRAMDWSLPDEEATTIAGLVIHEARLIPEAGQAFTFYGFRFEVMRRSRNKVTSLMITPVKAKEEA